MSIYSFNSFKGSVFSEPLTYTMSGGQPKTIRAVVFRSKKQEFKSKSDVAITHYPITLHIDASDIPIVTVNEDEVIVADFTGVQKVYRVRGIISSDPGSYTVGL